MADQLPLQILYSKNGEPLRDDQDSLLGEFDTSLGTEIHFYLKHDNTDLICNVSQLKTVNRNSTFIGPSSGFVNPGKTEKVTIRIHPNSKINMENFATGKPTLNSFPKSTDKLEGEIRWERVR